ncbi:DUF4956 domain-containing protein [Listeria newyorkensis]|uniref:DUF4956 domain-containing protein n=1 Tax=Listeria newyorkensis TaxID=1497681 RepID=A0ABX4XXQ3_9LIST|nr:MULTISPECIES: DUF4956 domain-containing protein [Listeria]KGL39084.1 cell division protein FtsZ [Listeriaceae bacterium FSL A5-0209]KGL43940.1 cell division protein FtsZ [Listeria newyorkensis]PNP94929.1 DUF4956 domain-containing protein [Listeria newyorkensis]RQW66303.1 DUF4956 domain-containing protein [Listeria sp. SHR_NRA_18]WAO21876.1 DUF4956 domain-containing protein [Listeria newyorkensis]
MLENVVKSSMVNLDVWQIIMYSGASVLLGVLVACVHMYRNTYSQSFIVTLTILPILVQSVIMLVNGNVGTGIAVLGAFSLIRFRSVAGGAREISSIFWSMGIGLATGMGYIMYALIFSAFVAVVLIVLTRTRFGSKSKVAERSLRISIPEDIDYANLFDDLLQSYGYEISLEQVRTTNMGSLMELRYYIKLKNVEQEKELIDAIRTKNGNLPVISGRVSSIKAEL